MEKLGNTIVDGKIIDLEKMSIDELNNTLKKIKKDKEIKKNNLNQFLNNMYN